MDIREFTVRDRLGTIVVTGSLLADRRFGSEFKPRWTDMALYKVEETSGHLQVDAQCGGCSPARRIQVDQRTLAEAPILCGSCDKPFAPRARQQDKPFRYLLEITARSWVYHKVPGKCVRPKHRIITVAEAYKSKSRWDNLVACNRCRPADVQDMQDDDRIAEEVEDPHIYLCADAPAILRRLYRRNGEISELAVKLLREAAIADPDIAAAWDGVRKI